MEPMRDVIEVGDPRLEDLVRILAASINARILAHLIAARRDAPDDGWRFLSQIALAVDEKPGTVGLAIQKLLPLLEERRHKGRRYFRTRLRRLAIEIDPY